VQGDIPAQDLPAEERAFLAEAAGIAAGLDWSQDPWHALTNALKASTGRKGKALFLPLRLALTGRDSGPEMAPLVRLIGKNSCVSRLQASGLHRS
jgi:glutamyl-tRNA synthetase